MSNFAKIDRRGFIAGAAALGGLAIPTGRAVAAIPKRGGTLRVSVDQAVTKINPLQTRVSCEYLVAELLYSGLTRIGYGTMAEPDLAHAWSYSADLTEWSFSLRDGLVFHDGTSCTAEDVVASFEAILDPATGSPAAGNVGPIARVTAKDRTTVAFTLSAPFADLPMALAYPNAKIIPAAVAKSGLARFDREAIGTGPFKLVTYEADRRVVVARNDRFYDRARPYLDGIEVLVYPELAAESSALIAGDTDLMLTVPPGEHDRLKAAAGVNVLRIASGQFCDIVFGCDQKPFDDVRVRRALALAIDRPALVDQVLAGFGTPGNDAPLNGAYRFYAAQPPVKPDIPRARKLLAEAGHPDGLQATLIASDKPAVRAQLAVAVRDMAKPAGFAIEVETMPHATYLDQVWKKGPFYVGFYNMQPTADAIFSLLYTSDAVWNETHWNNAAFDKLVGEARTTIDDAKRRQFYGEAQKLMHDDVPSVIPMFFDLLRAQRDYVQGYRLHPRGAVFRLDYVSLNDSRPRRI